MALTIRKNALIETEQLTIKPYASEDAAGPAALLTDRIIAKSFMAPEFESTEPAEALTKTDCSQPGRGCGAP